MESAADPKVVSDVLRLQVATVRVLFYLGFITRNFKTPVDKTLQYADCKSPFLEPTKNSSHLIGKIFRLSSGPVCGHGGSIHSSVVSESGSNHDRSPSSAQSSIIRCTTGLSFSIMKSSMSGDASGVLARYSSLYHATGRFLISQSRLSVGRT